MPEPAYLTLSQVALRTGRHPELLRQWCSRGRIPCTRVGGSWVLREQDVALVDGIARRARPPKAEATAVEHSARPRIIAAVFDDEALAATVADALRERLHLAHDALGMTSLALSALAPLRLSVVAGRFGGAASAEARRILVGYGGRIVADIDEATAEDGETKLRTGTSRRDDRGRGRGGTQLAGAAEVGGHSPQRAATR